MGWRMAAKSAPTAKLKVNINPKEIFIDWEPKKFKAIGVAFCAEKIAIATPKVATIKTAINGGINFIRK